MAELDGIVVVGDGMMKEKIHSLDDAFSYDTLQ